MKKKITFLFILFFPVLIMAQNGMDSLLKVLDKTVDNYQIYSNQKETEMNKLKDMLKYTSSDRRKSEISGKLYDE